MKHPKVSVVIPAYNHEKYVGEAIQSVLDQTYPDFELIIINDGSTDNTEAEILKFKDERIRYYSQENRGLSATLNRGIELAQGEYFNFLPSDDAFSPEKLKEQMEVFAEDANLGLIFTYPWLVDAEGKEIQEDPVTQWAIVPYETKEEIFPALFERNFLSAPTALVRIECFRRVGRFDESLKIAQDYDMWMRILKYYGLRLIKRPLLKYRWHGANLTFQASPETELERAKVLLKAYKNLTIEDIFPILRQRKDATAYAEAYEKLAAYLEKSGIPAVIPISQIYKDKVKSLRDSEEDFPNVKQKGFGDKFDLGRMRRDQEKIHLLVETPSLDKGGMEKVIFNICRGLDRDLFITVVVCTEKGGAIADQCREAAIPVEILAYDKEREYQEILERYEIDLTISHYSTFGARLAFEKGIPSLSVLHNVYSWFPDNVLSDFKSADRFILKYIAVSEDVKYYTGYRFNIPLEKILVIPNGIDVKAYDSAPPSKTLNRSDMGFKEEDYIFVNVASVGPPKGQNVILAGLRKMVQEYPNLRVLSIGNVLDEEYFNFLKIKIEEFQLSDHFRFVGFVEDVRPYLQMADAFLLPSFIEGWSMALMEAMLHQLPVILTRVGGAEETLGDSKAGIFISNGYDDLRRLDVSSLDQLSRVESPRNADELAEAMKNFLMNKESWREAGRRGCDRISQYFTLDRMIKSYEKELLTTFLGHQRSKEYWPKKMIHIEREVHQRLVKIETFYQDLLEENKKNLEAVKRNETLYQNLLEEKGKVLDELLKNETQNQEIVNSRLNQLDSKIIQFESRAIQKFETFERRIDYVIFRLSITERLKGLLYRLMKRIHKIVPVVARGKYREPYRKVFFDKVTPADRKGSFDKTTPAEEGQAPVEKQETTEVRFIGENPVRGFLKFKEEITRGLPVELEKFNAYHVPDQVSVVLPVYNQAHLLGQSIESVLNQTYQNLELIIVNDGSTDDIESVLQQYRGDSRITVIEQENQRLPKALSNGFRKAKGEFYTWTSADNLMDRRQLELQVEFLKENARAQMVYSNYHIIDDEGNPLLNSDYCPGYQNPPGSNHINLPKDPLELNVIRNNYIGPCFMYRAWLGRLIGDYDPFMFTTEDYDYWMIVNSFFKIEHLGKEDFLYFNRVHRGSLTGRKEELRIVENTDKLMEFENGRRDFYRKKFSIYLIGNHDFLGDIKRPYEENGNYIQQLNIPCNDMKMGGEKAIGIWISSPLEKGFIHRVMRENGQAFFVVFVLGGNDDVNEELLQDFRMILSISDKKFEKTGDRRWFYSEKIPFTLYPILCKANIELFRQREHFSI